MRVQCIHPGLTDELRACLDGETIEYIAQLGTASGLERGLHHVVYGFDQWGGLDGYYIADANCSWYPMWYPAVFFLTVDPRPSKHWQLSDWTSPAEPGFRASVIPPWAADLRFLEALLDGEPDAVAVFKQYRELMDLEFADDPARLAADHLQEAWVQCPGCDDAWEVQDRVPEMVRCPHCRAVWLSPFRAGD